MFDQMPRTPAGSIQILDFYIAPSGRFSDQFMRPYETLATAQTVEAIQTRFDQAGGNHQALTNGLFDGVASGFVSPQAVPEKQIVIPNGWGTERYFFILKVAVYNSLGNPQIDVIQGFSDMADPSFSGLPDPRTRFYINGITRTASARQHTAYGSQDVGMVKNSYQLLANPNYNGPGDFGIGGNTPNTSFLMRPQDIYETLHSSEYIKSDLVNLSTANTHVVRTSNRMNAVPSAYAGTVIKGYAEAVARDMYSPGGGHTYADAIGFVSDDSAMKDQFVRAISNVAGVPVTNSFQLQDLYRLDPQLQNPADQRMKIARRQELIQMNYHGGPMPGVNDYLNVNHWHGSDIETKAATTLANGLPALMLECGIIHLAFRATNHSTQPVIQTDYAQGIADNFDCRPVVPHLEARIQNNIISQISEHNQIAYQIFVDVKVAEATTISVQFENRPVAEFISPTFADSLLAPVLTGDVGRQAEVSSDFGTLVQHLVQVQSPSLDDIGSFANI